MKAQDLFNLIEEVADEVRAIASASRVIHLALKGLADADDAMAIADAAEALTKRTLSLHASIGQRLEPVLFEGEPLTDEPSRPYPFCEACRFNLTGMDHCPVALTGRGCVWFPPSNDVASTPVPA